MYNIVYRKSAMKALAKLPNPIAMRFMSAFEQLAVGETQELDIKKLVVDSRGDIYK
jgi:mRNA interferase RelE/StbE